MPIGRLSPVQALSMKDAYEAEDEVDDAAEDASEAQRGRARSAALATKGPLPDDQGMFFPARAYWGARPRRLTRIGLGLGFARSAALATGVPLPPRARIDAQGA